MCCLYHTGYRRCSSKGGAGGISISGIAASCYTGSLCRSSSLSTRSRVITNRCLFSETCVFGFVIGHYTRHEPVKMNFYPTLKAFDFVRRSIDDFLNSMISRVISSLQDTARRTGWMVMYLAPSQMDWKPHSYHGSVNIFIISSLLHCLHGTLERASALQWR